MIWLVVIDNGKLMHPAACFGGERRLGNWAETNLHSWFMHSFCNSATYLKKCFTQIKHQLIILCGDCPESHQEVLDDWKHLCIRRQKRKKFLIQIGPLEKKIKTQKHSWRQIPTQWTNSDIFSTYQGIARGAPLSITWWNPQTSCDAHLENFYTFMIQKRQPSLSLTAIFVLSPNTPSQQMATHIQTTLFPNFSQSQSSTVLFPATASCQIILSHAVKS